MSNNTTKIEICQGLPKAKWKYFKQVQQLRIIDVIKMTFKPKAHIKKLSKQTFKKYEWVEYKAQDGESRWARVLSKEVFEFNLRKEGNDMSKRTVRKKFVDLRQLIAANFEGAVNEIFLTLTYRGELQTNDPKKIHDDFRNFWKRLKRCAEYKEHDLGYIAIVEPHETGNWHIHLLLKSMDGKSMRSDDYNALGVRLFDVWKQGYVKAEALDCTHIGAYFIAYMTNAELTDEQAAKYENQDDIKIKDGKKYLKGERMKFYKDYMQLYRRSDNIIKPDTKNTDKMPENYKRTYAVGYKTTTEEREAYIAKEQWKEKKA